MPALGEEVGAPRADLSYGSAMSERVLVAMSGGVDSSVAAALLMDEGYEVVGVTLHLWDYPDDGSVKGRCCAPEDVHDARRVADLLGFPHYAFDRRELFEKEVVAPFVEGYLSGSTPSPCVRCNRGVKVRELITLADRLGARFVATGHYARLERRGERLDLLRGLDASKDQSYFLHMLESDVLARFLFPLGHLDKNQVRSRAVELGLPGATKGESQELCFVPTGRYDHLVEHRSPDRVRPGPIIAPSGQVVGEHGGIHRFTRGQRKNLGVAVGERAYVVDIDPSSGAVQLGRKDQLETDRLSVSELSLRDGVELPAAAQIVIRYRGKPSPGKVVPGASSDAAHIQLEHPVMAPSTGQYAVFYEGDRVLGGGLISHIGPAQEPAPRQELSC